MTDSPHENNEPEAELPETSDAKRTEEQQKPEGDQHAPESEFAGFHARMTAVGLDVFWIFLLLTPLSQWLTASMFGALNIQEGSALAQHLMNEVGIFSMTTAEAFSHFAQSKFATRWLIENVAQAVISGIAIVPFWVYKGATPGMWLLGLRVVDATTQERPGWVQSVLRYIVSVISFIPLMLGFVWVITNQRRQAWHDIAAHTLVIRKKWKWNKLRYED